VNDLVLRQLTHTPDPGSPWALRKKLADLLTEREMQFFLGYIAEDEPTIAEMGVRMKITYHGAESHRKNIVEKLEVSTRTGWLWLALRFAPVEV